MQNQNFDRGLIIDRIVEEFETAWLEGLPKSIETLLAQAPELQLDSGLRMEVLRELLLVEIEFRRDARELPVLGEYRKRFPNDDGVMKDVFETAGILCESMNARSKWEAVNEAEFVETSPFDKAETREDDLN